MRILFVIDGLPGGGAEKVVLTLAEYFLSQGEQVSLFSLRNVCDYPLPEGLDYQVIADSCRKPWRKLTELSRRARQLDAAVDKAEQQGRFDLILSNLHKTDRIVSRSRVLAGRNLWFCLHGMFSTSYLGHRTGFDRWIKQQKIKRVYQGRNVVTVSDAVGRDLVEQFAVRPAQLKTIYNPFDIAALRAAADAPSERPEGDYIIHVGRFHPGKRHDRLIEAYAQSGIEAPLVLLGQGKPEQEQRLHQLVQQLQIGDRVLFKGFQKNPLPWIKGARMLVLSSDSEGFGNVVVEALLLGTPVASTRSPGGVAEILTGELARGLADLNSPALAQTMQSVYHSPPTIDPARLEKFSVASISQQYRQLRSI
ncbi:MAG TPA: glycosyltransferase [Klebsiella sp.]|jgi:glycosyltransferase involved in cell wall biosynthesis